MKRKFTFSFGEFYHIYNRGTDKRTIFVDQNDHKRFLLILFACNSTQHIDVRELNSEGESFGKNRQTIVDIGAYCLMPNHFHLLIKEKSEGGISLFMRKLLTAYSMYFNRKYKRTGKLFEGAFKATHAETDEYLKYLLSYIHLNPVKMFDKDWKEKGIKDKPGAKKYLSDYNYSSYLDYIGVNREESLILNKKAFPEYFASVNDFDKFIDNWLSLTNILISNKNDRIGLSSYA
jgi:putative transposase